MKWMGIIIFNIIKRTIIIIIIVIIIIVFLFFFFNLDPDVCMSKWRRAGENCDESFVDRKWLNSHQLLTVTEHTMQKQKNCFIIN
jgi:hypothetical protein